MKSLDLSQVTAARERLASAEADLLAMRERQAAAVERVATRQAETLSLSAARRSAVVSGQGEEEARSALAAARVALEQDQEDVEFLSQAAYELESAVIDSENALLVELERVRLAQYESAKKALSDSILKLGPPYQSAALGVGLAWGTIGKMLADLGDRDLGPYWQKTQPIEELVARHKSQLVSEDRRAAG